MSNILLENYLASQFKFGFELEAFVKDGWKEYVENDSLDDVDEEEDDDYTHWDNGFRWYEVEEKDAKETTQHCIADSFKLNKSDVIIKHDGSLEPENNMDYAFEWATPTFQFTPSNLKKCIEGLNDLFTRENFYTGDKLFYTNETCGFHVHLSFPNISDADCVWIISKLSVDESMLGELMGFGEFEFWNDDYAEIEFLQNLGEFIREGNIDRSLGYVFSTEKYRALHIHSQGTIEWRGPRDFMNNYNKKNVYKFFKLLHKFVTWISHTLTENEIVGISKSNFFKMIYGKAFKENDLIDGFKYHEKLNKKIRRYTHMVQSGDVSEILKLIHKWCQTYDNDSKKEIHRILDAAENLILFQKKEFCRNLLMGIVNIENDDERTYAFKFLDGTNFISQGFNALNIQDMVYYFNKILSKQNYNLSITKPVILSIREKRVEEAFKEAFYNCQDQAANKYALATLFSYLTMIEKYGEYIKTNEILDMAALNSLFDDIVQDISYKINSSKEIMNAINSEDRSKTLLSIFIKGHTNPILGNALSVVMSVYRKKLESYKDINIKYGEFREDIVKFFENILLTGKSDND